MASNTSSFVADGKTEFCNLQFTNLSGLIFSYTNLSHFNLVGSNFSNSFLYEVDFTGVMLENANFSKTFFRDPKGLTQEQIKQAFYWKVKPPAGLPCELKLIEKDTNEDER